MPHRGGTHYKMVKNIKIAFYSFLGGFLSYLIASNINTFSIYWDCIKPFNEEIWKWLASIIIIITLTRNQTFPIRRWLEIGALVGLSFSLLETIFQHIDKLYVRTFVTLPMHIITPMVSVYFTYKAKELKRYWLIFFGLYLSSIIHLFFNGFVDIKFCKPFIPYNKVIFFFFLFLFWIPVILKIIIKWKSRVDKGEM